MGERARLEALAARLPAGRAGLLRWPEEISSTNTALKAWAEEGAPAGSVILAERQSAGRGRLGRRFESPPGGLYLSYLLRPDLDPEELGEITPRTAVAVRRALGDCCGLRPEIKWVNDLVWQGKKLCGVLCESVLRRGRVESLIVGIGINVDTAPEEFSPDLRDRAASLRSLGYPAEDRSALAASLILALDALARAFPAGGEACWREYRAHCLTLGKRVTLSDGSEGLAEDLDRDYALLVRLPAGNVRRLRSGEATLHQET